MKASPGHVAASLPAWTEVQVEVPLEWAELVADILGQAPWTAVVFGAPSLATDGPPAGRELLRSYVIEHEDTAALRAQLEQRLAGLAATTGAVELRGLRARFRRLPPEDYASSWRKSWRAFRCGNLAVVPPDHSAPLRATDVRIELEPGGAFGTGRHATTRGCLHFLQQIELKDCDVVDCGSGSGLLAVAACRLGARRAFGFDIDPNALPYARHLAAQNRVDERCSFQTAGFEALDDRDVAFDLALANIYADVIEGHAPALASCLKPNGHFIVSGCVRDKRPRVERALAAAGLRVDRHSRRGRWDTFAGQSTKS